MIHQDIVNGWDDVDSKSNLDSNDYRILEDILVVNKDTIQIINDYPHDKANIIVDIFSKLFSFH